MATTLTLDIVAVDNPDELNLILGQTHFIKSVEDLHEALVGTVPGIQFGLAFCEASGPRLIRTSGTAPALTRLPPGCSFAPRCSHAMDICRRVRPSLEPAGPGRVLACHLEAEAHAGAD